MVGKNFSEINTDIYKEIKTICKDVLTGTKLKIQGHVGMIFCTWHPVPDPQIGTHHKNFTQFCWIVWSCPESDQDLKKYIWVDINPQNRSNINTLTPTNNLYISFFFCLFGKETSYVALMATRQYWHVACFVVCTWFELKLTNNELN